MMIKNMNKQYTLIRSRRSLFSFAFFSSSIVSPLNSADRNVLASTISTASCWLTASPCNPLYISSTCPNFFWTDFNPRSCIRSRPSSSVNCDDRISASDEDDDGVNGLKGCFADTLLDAISSINTKHCKSDSYQSN